MALFDDASLVVTPNGYKAGTLYSIKPTSGAGDMTVVRATTATRVNSAGLIESVAINVPRLDYLNASCPSLLLEPQRTNLILQSENWSASWSLLRVTNSANSTTSPDGTLSADQLLDTAVSGTHVAIQTITKAASPITYTASIYLKPNVRTRGELRVSDQSGNGVRNTFNLSNGTIGTQATFGTGFTAVASTITSVGNGWYRMSLMATTNSSTTLGHEIYISNDSANPSYIGNGSGFYVWGAQLEAGSYPTSYIPTTTAAVTRNADAISKTGISSLIGQTEGTVFVDYVLNGQTNNANILNSEKNTTCSLFMAQRTNGNFSAGLYVSGSFVGLIQAGSLTIGQHCKVAYAYKSGSFALYINGVQEGILSSTFTLPTTLDDIYINDPTTYFNYQEAVQFNQVALFPTRLTNAELASLTTL
jgi:hypothetical protein